MWYTLVIILDIFLAWFITNSLISLFQWCMPFLPYAFPVMIMRQFHVPSGFIALSLYLPNALLVGVYFMYRLPKWNAFCSWSGWEWMRRRHFQWKGPEFTGASAPPPAALAAGGGAETHRRTSPPRIRRRSGGDGFEEHTYPPPAASAAGGGGGGKTESREGHSAGAEAPAEWPHLSHQVIYAVVPHAIFAESVTFLFTLNPVFQGCTTIATSLLFWIPIVREFACLAGVVAANTANIAHELDAGRSILMLPEGMRGALHVNEPGGILRVLEGNTAENEPRKGFIRCAIASNRNVWIVPVYNQGAEKTYTTFHVWPWFQKIMLKNYMYPWPLLSFGWYGSFWPKPVPIRTLVGEPIRCKGRSVDEVHAEYCKAVRALINSTHGAAKL